MMTFEQMAELDGQCWERTCPADINEHFEAVCERLDAEFGLDLPPEYYLDTDGTYADEVEIEEGGGGPSAGPPHSSGATANDPVFHTGHLAV